MEQERFPRKLAAILYADVAGYSRLTGADEDATHRRLRDSLDLISNTVTQQRGRVMHYAGDAVLAMFDAVVDALSCAIAIQDRLAGRNRSLDASERLQFRVGVNLGDVIEDRGDIYGEGVNVAARLEALARPGGICVSDAVRVAVGNKLEVRFEDLGAQSVKNIAEPVRSFHVVSGRAQEAPATPGAPTQNRSGASTELATVAMRPLRFIGDAGEHGHLAEALTESIAAALAHFRDYRVVEEAGDVTATYALGGTLQVAGSQLRISPSLVAGADGRKLWTGKFDRELGDVFELQDEISAMVAAYLGEAIWQETARTLERKHPDEFTAMDWCVRAVKHLHRTTRADYVEARYASEQALAMDAGLMYPKLLLAFALPIEIELGWADDPTAARAEGLELTQELLARDPNHPMVHRVAARLYPYLNRHDDALRHAERALELNPYDGDLLVGRGLCLMQAGDADAAVPWIEKATRYNPQPPAFYLHHLVLAQFLAGKHRDALQTMERLEGGIAVNRLVTAAVLQAAGSHERAARFVEDELTRRPGTTVRRVEPILAGHRNPDDVEAVKRALRDAGVPGEPLEPSHGPANAGEQGGHP